ncbi:MAG: hypothetical protein Unbinned4409contig1002_22 [Prokaryotic dsDNA virus sp.]|nr:MAG: hypothetical protein Unbinned4409contig1002_22 [Prokaryotic dsDNA virus sp.]|tara:strand:+ start:12265 stop:12495 length:231 start_codon:yes stop_codon:yes gene_type:complete
MSIRVKKDNRNKELPDVARNTIAILSQTIGHIKRHPKDQQVLAILANSITLLTSLIRPYIDEDTSKPFQVDTTLKN